MAVNKIEIALKEALKKAMVKCNFVEDYEIDHNRNTKRKKSW